jgi:adenosylcobinamide kinase/adenosylcobinamide-phosphate guanylyltransferase
MAGKIILVTGGARSGKSAFAEKLAAEMGTSIGYIATAQIYDEEMRYRVKLHRERRPSSWQTWGLRLRRKKRLPRRQSRIKYCSLTVLRCISAIICAESSMMN